MPKTSEKTEPPIPDIFSMLQATSKKDEKAKRKELLEATGVKELFEEGTIEIDIKTCRGVECKLCIKACPTKALYWRAGEVGIARDLCVYCAACVLNCIVDDCIKIKRKRADGTVEKFTKPADVLALQNRICGVRRKDLITSIFTDEEAYYKRYVNR